MLYFIDRLKKGTYGDIYNFPQTEYEEVLSSKEDEYAEGEGKDEEEEEDDDEGEGEVEFVEVIIRRFTFITIELIYGVEVCVLFWLVQYANRLYCM